ncbi:hypothetical protein [Paenibacillus sp. Y412MC10]|uniref:hypothetical protein n=1 Tax=Geobacillus sp. (strain Y412MC10) TaxID=481743 RepID=UPI00119F4499|nr:hypothetical protein [Paenibacillus sp. Y412MC10]
MDRIENQSDYYILFNFHDGYYSLTVVPNYIVIATDTKEGLNKACEVQSILYKLIKVEFNLQSNDFIVELKNNEYFDKVIIHEYLAYDPEKGEDATLTKEQFVALLKEDYKEYLEKNGRLTFESNAYGVVPRTEVHAVNEVS